jgi:NTP pyrophosphatase (non-canonical NTP hydrolase)
MLTVGKYAEAARTTALYPNMGNDLTYPLLGLCGEIGEVCEKMKKLIRDHNGICDKDYGDKISKEIGDVLWYVMNFSIEANFNVTENNITFTELQDKSYRELTDRDKMIDENIHIEYSFELIKNVAYIVNNVNKQEISNKHGVYLTLSSIVHYLAIICESLNLSLQSCAEGNIKKLLDRKSRNVIKGEGDDR